MSKVWFITGTSKGFGRIWAEAALERGDRVAATARNIDTLERLVERYGDNVLPLALDVTDKAAVDAAVAAGARALRPPRRRDQQRRLRPVRHDRGGHRGAGPRADRDEPVRRAVGDQGRRCRSCASRAPATSSRCRRSAASTPSRSSASTTRRSGALEAFSQSLAAEVAEFGIKVTLVEPTGYSTDWRGPSAVQAAALPAYDGVREARAPPFAGALARTRATRGPPARRSSTSSTPRSRRCASFFGSATLDMIRAEYERRIENWERWDELANAAQGGVAR